MTSTFDWETQARTYFKCCNKAEAAAIAGRFSPAAVHYFPSGIPGTPVIGAPAIAERLVGATRTAGSVWTVDAVVVSHVDPLVVVEWTNFRTHDGSYLRGDEWILFDPESGLIDEIRPYYAAPPRPEVERSELGGFDYRARGYPISPPFRRRPPGKPQDR